MIDAVTDASTTAPNAPAAKSASSSSRAKNTPAIGALNVAAIPPAAPQATSARTRDSGSLRVCASQDPRAEPICTIGPSRPTDPPEPIQIAEASALTTATRPLIRPPEKCF